MTYAQATLNLENRQEIPNSAWFQRGVAPNFVRWCFGSFESFESFDSFCVLIVINLKDSVAPHNVF